MKNNKLQCDTAREIPITEYLKRSGYSPVKENLHSAWYLSPIRKESEASFKVSKILNRWYDHGIGKGGNIIDLVIEMNNNCSISEALVILAKNIPSFSFQQQNNVLELAPDREAGNFEICIIKMLQHQKTSPISQQVNNY